MLTFVVIGCILTAHIQPSLADKEEEDEPVSCPTISSSSTEVGIGSNVTLKCSSERGSLPIKYTLYKGKDRVLTSASKNKKGEAAAFHFTINFISDLGEYKCKAENKVPKDKYSPGFNFTLGEPVSHPEIYSPSREVSIDENVTLSCLSKNGSLPIKYTLYKGRNKVLFPATKNKTGEAAEFHFRISELGEYKCKAENNLKDEKYSRGFNFTVKAEKRKNNNLVVFIVLPLLLLLLAFVVAVPFLILPWCKARKLVRDISPTVFVASDPSAEHYVTYAEIEHEKGQEEYINMELKTKKESRKGSFRDAATVVYSEIIRR